MPKVLLSCGLVLCLGLLARAQGPIPEGLDGACWVWDQPGADQVEQTNEPRYLRRTFSLAGKVIRAELWVTADNHFIAYLNGQKVGEHGEWSQIKRFDVVRFLVPGKNVLAIQARNQGGPAGVIARLNIQGATGKGLSIVTDSKSRITPIQNKDWLRADYDDSAWPTAVVLGPAGMGPWNLAGAAAAAPTGYDAAAVDPKVKNRLSAQEQLRHFVVPKDFVVELVAADPVVINPITMTLDEKGRIYVSESHTYRYGPGGSPVKPFANPVVRLEPGPDGKLQRTLVADGFADPVMGIALKGNKLWLTANNFLYQYDLTAEGKAVNKKTILVDKNKAWNPFGMFVLEWGLDGLLYMSVGDHVIDIHGPEGRIGGRRNSGIIMRMKADGTGMHRLVHGLRVPYSFEYDPFGQLWLLSNGEGNPNRFVRVLEGIDYHCYSRPGIDNEWLAGRNPLAPPCYELHRGANTQLIRYYGAGFPSTYWGDLLLDNWGAHGFAGPNRGVFRFVPDGRNNIVKREPLLSCTDPHFRPSHIVLDPDGNLLIADWYGRDDESDLTGRIWRLKYVGKNRPAVKHRLDSPDWARDDYAVSALGSPHHLIREKAMTEVARRGTRMLQSLSAYVASAQEPLGAASALWTLLRLNDSPEVRAAFLAGTRHPDWKVRRLAVNLVRRYRPEDANDVATLVSKDSDPAVRIEAALAFQQAKHIRATLLDALEHGAASDEHLRYEAAWHLARHADAGTFERLLSSDRDEIRLAGLIALDVACFEDFATKPMALAALRKTLETTGKLDPDLLLTVARLDGDASVVPALQKMIARPDLPAAVIGKAVLVLRARGGNLGKGLSAAAGKRLLEAVAGGSLRLTSLADQLMIFELLEAEGPSAFALQQIAGQLRGGHPQLREAAHLLARRFGSNAAPLAEQLWPLLFTKSTRLEDALELLSTVARIEDRPKVQAWEKLLRHPDPLLRAEAVRWWRTFKDNPKMTEILSRQAPELVKSDAGIKDDLGAVFSLVNQTPEPVKGLGLPVPEKDKDALARLTLKTLDSMPATQRHKRALLGRQVFERTGCTKCHTTATQTTLLAPSLKGVAAQKNDYLIESVLFPSRVIKTGFESETIITRDGKVLSGLVKDEGNHLRVLNLDRDDRVAKADVESRTTSRVSIMPEGQEAQLSRPEFVDLIAYLATLR
jgi:putative heme-binding domain-containing protein